MEKFSKIKFKTGWLPDYKDFRDFTPASDSLKDIIQPIGLRPENRPTLPISVDLRNNCSPVEDQESIGSCTAQAGAALVEYFENLTHDKHMEASRLFLYKVTRNLLHFTGDTGAYLRTTMGALVLFGAPAEEYWPYDISKFDEEPPAFCYSFAQNFQALRYLRLDPPKTDDGELVYTIKKFLAYKLPIIFGFTVYNSISQAQYNDGKIPYPSWTDRAVGGHAVMAVGYDDNIKIKNTYSNEETTGAILIKNSWGTGWGDGGYGWLPYEYVHSGMAQDWWTLLKKEWVDTTVFGL